MSNFQHGWGDTVRVGLGAPAAFRPGEAGSICGIRAVVAGDEIGAGVYAPYDDVLYLIEFGDGSTIELSQDFVEPVE